MAFNRTGDIPVKIIATAVTDSKFKPEDTSRFDIVLQLEDLGNPGMTDYLHMEVSSEYFKEKTRAQLAFETLEKIGFKGGMEIARLEELIGTETSAHVEESKPNADGKTFKNVKWIGGSNAPKSIDKDDAKLRLAAIMGKKATLPVQTPAAPSPAKTATVGNPFAKKA